MHAHGHPHVCWLTGLLIPIYHTLSRHQDATLAKQCSAAGQDPECWLLWVPLLDKHGSSRRPDSAGGIRRRADVHGYMPRPLGFCEVVWTEIVEFATNCGEKSKIVLKKYLCQEWKRSPCQFCILYSQCDAQSQILIKYFRDWWRYVPAVVKLFTEKPGRKQHIWHVCLAWFILGKP